MRAGSAAHYTVAAFRPMGLALTPKGPQAPPTKNKKVSPRLSLDTRARDRHRMAETGFPQLPEAWLREAAKHPYADE